jgi:hypothetical protein
MTHTFTFVARATAVAAALALGTSAFAATDVSSNIELDNTHQSGSAVAAGADGLTQSGRVEVNLSSKAGAQFFVAGKAALIAGKSGAVTTDDMWIQLGTATADVKLGRFEGADLFGLQGDTLVQHAGSGVFGANTLRGRKGTDVFHAQGTVNFGGGFAFELGAISSTNAVIAAAGSKGYRPVLSYTAGPLAVAAGIESGEYASTNKVDSTGLSVAYNFGGFTLKGVLSRGKQDGVTNTSQTGMGLSVSMGALGLGVASGTNDIVNATGDKKVQTVYASYNIPLFDVKGASVTPAISQSTEKNSVTSTSVDVTAVRVRLNYAF